MRYRGVVALLALALCGSGAWATSPRPGLTKGEAIKAFVDAANLGCVYSRVSGAPIDSVPGHIVDDLVPADADDRRIVLGPKDRPAWVSKSLGSLLQVFEDKKGACMVVAIQLPVQATLDAEAKMLRDLGGSAYVEKPFKVGDNPIGYEFERVVDGDVVTIHMEGAEPGLPMHTARQSLMWVRVTRTAGKAR